MSGTAVEHRPRPLGFLPRSLFEPSRPARYVAVAWACAFLPSLLLSALATHFVPEAGPSFPEVSPGFLLFLLVVFAPILETLIMGAVLLVLDRLLGFLPAVLLSSAGWGIAHSLQAPAWGLVIWWPFLIFSTLYVVWRQRGFLAGVGVAAATHAMQNLIPAIAIAFG